MPTAVPHNISIADLSAAGLRLRPVEAVTIARELTLRAHRGALPGIPTSSVLRFTSEGDTRGTWDAERITRVVSNLLGNAVRHGKVDAQIDVALDGRASEQVTLRVTNGGAIAADALATLFAPFRDKDPTRKRTEGLGLGLFIVSEIVTAHGGSVGVHSADGSVSFHVELPRRPPVRSSQPPSA